MVYEVLAFASARAPWLARSARGVQLVCRCVVLMMGAVALLPRLGLCMMHPRPIHKFGYSVDLVSMGIHVASSSTRITS